MTRWVMLADLERCVGCQTCTAACRHANATPPSVQWRKVLDVESGVYPDVRRTFAPVGCQHCEEPPCMEVCPSTATRRRADGIVTIDYDLCIGCAYCAVACPYQARFKVDAPRFAYGAMRTRSEWARGDSRRLGVAQKCTFCVERIDAGIELGITPGVDPGATPACVNSCIAGALHFGDLDDPASNVSKLLREHRHFRMHEGLGTGPGFYYLHANENGTAAAAASQASPATAPGRIRAKGVEPALQAHWDWRASGNFMGGGAGAGLLLFAALAASAGISAYPLALLALGLIAAGLFLVWLEIGRPLRFLHVLLQPQQSWMTREAWAALVLFALGLAAVWFERPWLLGAAALVGLAFLYCQARILAAAKGIPAWREPRIVPLILSTGICEGAGLFLVAAALMPALGPLRTAAAAGFAVLVGVRGVFWRAYLASLESGGAPIRALEVLQMSRAWFLLFGIAIPIVMSVAAFMAPGAAGAMPLAIVAGSTAVGAGWWLKFILITRAAYNQGFALAHVPVRGSGAPGPSVRPGWAMQ
jgi:Fe-S-cluster-containing dehydrogenase component/DMSO reductase anchor subunit